MSSMRARSPRSSARDAVRPAYWTEATTSPLALTPAVSSLPASTAAESTGGMQAALMSTIASALPVTALVTSASSSR